MFIQLRTRSSNIFNILTTTFAQIRSVSAERMAKGLPKKLPIAGVENVILVGSGKGGVGKSATAINIAIAIKQINKKFQVGILDADIYGPSIPKMMGLNSEPEATKQNLMKPLINYGVKCMSMGFLVKEDAAIIWRGLMVMQAIEGLLRKVAWGPLDYLVVDLPPGTGDTQLSIVQNIPVSGAVIVTTPQDIALLDAKRAAIMFSKTNIPILGIVENMSVYNCPKCGHQSHIFGSEGAANLSKEIDLELLGSVPIDINIRKCGDEGHPIAIAHPDCDSSKAYYEIADKIIKKLS